MPRTVSTAIQNSFIGGFVTQATALDFPENAAFDQDNCIFSELGIAQRRFGMDFENNFTTNTQDRTEKAQATYYWKNAAGDGNTNFVVQQNGGTLSFYNTNDALSLSGGLSGNTVSLSSFQSAGSTQANLDQNECQFSTGLGYLFVVHSYCDPFYVLFNPADGSFTASIITFTIRDLTGIPENVLVDNRPTSLTANHKYNLLNQGWDTTKIGIFSIATQPPPAPVLQASALGGTLAAGTVFVKLTFVGGGGETLPSAQTSQVVAGTTSSIVVVAPGSSGSATGYNVYASTAAGTNVLQATNVSLNVNYTITSLTTGTASPPGSNTYPVAFPSNADVWWVFNDSTDTFSPTTALANSSRGSTPAPQGYFRLNPWSTARAATALAQAGATLSLTGTSVDQTSGTIRPSATEFHAGRVFYTGVNAPGYNSFIYFSKIIQSPMDFGACCADDDPTSETLFDFLPSDGGIIAIPQAGTIFRLVSLGATMLVFAANGVWAISGSTGIGFSATDYSVSVVGLVRSISGSSFTIIDGAVAWWNNTGINIVQNDPTKGLFIQSMTDGKIKDYYLDLDNGSKRFARGVYNPRTHVVQWLFRTAPAGSISDTYTYDSVLNFNTLIGAWYTWDLPIDQVGVTSLVVIEGSGSLTGSNNIVDNSANLVIDNAGDQLITYGFAQTTITTSTKFLVYANGKFTFAENFNVVYKDWTQFVSGGQDYTSFFTTGYLVKTQGERRFQTNYLFVFNDLSGGAINSYIFQALWNYGTSGNTGQWTQRQTISQDIIHTETNFDAGRRKLKVRGSGTALQFKFTSVSGQPFNIIGWSTYDTANQAP